MGNRIFSTATGREITQADSYRNGVRDGYEQAAVYLDAMAMVWTGGTVAGHLVAGNALSAAAECVRKLKGSL